MAAHGSEGDQTRSFTALAAGTRISHYTIISKIGAGGMGEVYLAEDTELHRKVALKFLPMHLCQDDDCRKRFKREAQAAAKLDHPHIVSVYEVGEFQRRPFFAMAHIEGRSLREVIREGKLTVEQAIAYTKQICEGLHKAHESGVVHRDIKPGNVIIDTEDRVRIVDFGLATVSGEEKLTKTGSTLGTVGYMSPEQIEGQKVDHRSDLFSVGVMLYEMLTGRRPFEGDTDAAVGRAITDATPEPIARYKSGTTGELQQIINKALQKDPSLRYQHADGMLADLRRLEVGVVPVSRVKRGLQVATAAILILVGYLVLNQLGFIGGESSDASDHSVAVLVFRDLSPERDQDWFCEGMTSEIIDRLTSIRGLRVPSIQSMLRYKASDLDLSKIGKELNVEHVLHGNIQKLGDRLRIRVQLTRIDDEANLWSNRYERQIEDVFAIQDEISLALADVLETTLIGGEEIFASRQGTESIEAYNAYLQGRYFWRKITAEGTRRAMEHFERAVELDSNFALAWSGLADSWLGLGNLQILPQAEAALNAKPAARKAIALSDMLAEGHASMGLVHRYEGNLADAIAEFDRALELNPNYVWTHIWYGRLMKLEMRRKDFEIEHLEIALKLDPLNAVALSNMATVLSDSGLYDKAESYYLTLVDAVPENTVFRMWFAWHYKRAGELDKVVEQFEQAIQIDPCYWLLYFYYAGTMNEINRVDDAHRVFETAESRMPDSAAIQYQYARFLHFRLADNQTALQKLQKAIALNPQYAEAYNLMAYVYVDLDLYDSALAAVNQAIQIVPTNSDYLDTRGDVYYAFGYLDEAIQSYRQHLEKRPHNMEALRKLGEAAIFARQYKLADSAFAVTAEDVSLETSGWGQFESIKSLRHQGRFREVVEAMKAKEASFRKELGASDQIGGIFWNRAQIYFDWLKDYDKALDDLDSLEACSRLVDDPQIADAQYGSAIMARSLVYAMMGDYATCDSLWSRVDSVKYRDHYYDWLGYIQLEKGNADSAIKCLETHRKGAARGLIEAAWLGMAYLEAGKSDKAVENLERGVFRYDSEKGVWPGYAVWYRYQLAMAYEENGQNEEAIEQYRIFLDTWKNADPDLESLADAKSRLARLTS